MKLNSQQQGKLDKVFNLYNDNAAKKTKESDASLHKLQELCKSYKVDFADFMKSKGVNVEKTEIEAPKVKTVKASRRNFIIVHMRENCWDKASLAEAIALHFPDCYADLKKNQQAISGTIYDLNSNKKASIAVCDADGRIVFKSMKK